MVEKINHTLLKSQFLTSIEFVVIHNDAGTMTPRAYITWLSQRDKSLGIAHYYINKDEIVRVVDTYNMAYHTGDWLSNCQSLGYEICQSMSASDEDFLLAEDICLMQATEDLIFYGLDINFDTVRLHHEFVPTACPHRSLELHGGTTQSVKTYFVNRMKYFATLGSDFDTIYQQYKTKEVAYHLIDDIETVALKVIRGEYGNGEERKIKLEADGYHYDTIQARVNEILS